ncbi:helix-turn-helix domain-containing protein, partial [Shewanella sp. 0m-11]
MDLYYRLNVFPIAVPPLRQRLGDIPALVSHLIQDLNRKLGKKVDRVSQRGMKKLMLHRWPGNVRELQNVLEREMILSHGPILEFAQLPAPHQPDNVIDAMVSNQTLQQVEKQHILSVLKQTQWRISGANGAAAMLGLPPSTLRSRMNKLVITRPV